MNLAKTKSWRSRKYLDWVRSQDCVVCGRPADDPHHVIGIGHMGGMGMKAPDQATMPVCRGCHDWIHRTPDVWLEQWQWVAKTLIKAVQDGVLTTGGKHG